jgi:hypothetical protein
LGAARQVRSLRPESPRGWLIGTVLPRRRGRCQPSGGCSRRGCFRVVRGGGVRRVDRDAGIRVPTWRRHCFGPCGNGPAGPWRRDSPTACRGRRPPLTDAPASCRLRGPGLGDGWGGPRPFRERPTDRGVRVRHRGQHGYVYNPAGAVSRPAIYGQGSSRADRRQRGRGLGRELRDRAFRRPSCHLFENRADRSAVRSGCGIGVHRSHTRGPGAGVGDRTGR